MDTPKKVERDSNFELLRILLMSAIVMGHFFGQAHIHDYLHGFNYFMASLLGSGSRIAVSVFVMLGCWFLVDAKFKASKVLNLYFQMLFYTLSISILIIFATGGGNMSNSPLELIRSIFPFWGFALWFVVAWMWLIILSPFLQNVLNWKRENLKKLILVLTFLIPVLSTIYVGADKKLDVMAYFIFAFICIGYYKKYLNEKINIKPYIPICISVVLYIILVFIQFCGYEYNIPVLKTAQLYLGDYKTIPNLIIAIPVFYLFKNIDIGKNKIINTIAAPVLAVYIIHQSPGFKYYLWHNILKSDYFLQTKFCLLYIILIPVILFITAMITEFIRKNIPKLLKLKRLKYICALENKIDDFYKEI